MLLENKTSDTSVIEIVELLSEEIQLIKVLRRSLKFGEVTITIRDGIPVKVKRMIEYHDLST